MCPIQPELEWLRENHMYFIPRISLGMQMNIPLVEYYNKNKREVHISDFYNKAVLIEFRNELRNLILSKDRLLVDHNSDNLFEISVHMLSDNYDKKQIVHNDKGIIELDSNDFIDNNYKIIISFDIYKSDHNLIDQREFEHALTIELLLRNPIGFTPENYIDHGCFTVCLHSKNAYKPSTGGFCLGVMGQLGTENCEFKKYLKIKNTKQCIKELSEHLFNIKERIPDNTYLEMENILLDLHRNI